MSAWDSAKKAAKSFGVKGFLYGALAGAAIGAGILLVLSMGVWVGGAIASSELVVGSSVGATMAAGLASMQAAASSMSLSGFAMAAGAGAVAGSALGALGGAATGCVYGAATDESNPLPGVVERAAHKIVEKAPNLAESVAAQVNNRQVAAQRNPALPNDAPSTAFQDKLQAREPEMAVAQR